MSTTTYRLNTDVLRQGDIIEKHTKSMEGYTIRAALSGRIVPPFACDFNHDAIVVCRAGHWYVGDAEPPAARLRTLEDYGDLMTAGKCWCRVVRPVNTLTYDGAQAAAWWRDNVLGMPYDVSAFPALMVDAGHWARLLAKALWGDNWPSSQEWAWYCTEGCRDAWRHGAGNDPWQKARPTPYTTQKRARAGAFQVIQDAIVKKAG